MSNHEITSSSDKTRPPEKPVVSLLTVGGKLGEKWVQERSPVAMEEMQVAEIGSFCLNEACEDYQKVHHGNMIKHGKTDKGVQRHFCKTCKKSFTATKGTMFYRCRHTEEEIVECMSMLGDRSSLAAIHRIKGIKEDAKGTFWSGKAIDMESRLRIGCAIGKSEEEIAPELMEQVKMHAPDEGPPALSSDGKGAYPKAMLETWGKVPEYGGREAPPTLPKPGKDWQCLQVIKKRKGRKLESVRIKIIYGDPKEVKAKLGCHTAYIERTNLTDAFHEWEAGPQNAFLLKRTSFS